MKTWYLLWLLVVFFLLSACTLSKKGEIATPFLPSENTSLATPTLLPSSPAPTAELVAARVNGESISLREYQAELIRYQAALSPQPTALNDEGKKKVLDELIQQTLLSQWAKENGFALDDVAYEQRLNSLIQKSGGTQAFQAWLQENHYDEESFSVALHRNIAVAWARDQIADSVPQNVEQVHARQLLFFDPNTADQVYTRLQAGEKFIEIAMEYDPLAKGDLGWFPKGYLLETEIDRAIFGEGKIQGMQPGEYSKIIQTRLGYHIIEVIEREHQRLLSPHARLTLQQQMLQQWLKERHEKSQIEIL